MKSMHNFLNLVVFMWNGAAVALLGFGPALKPGHYAGGNSLPAGATARLGTTAFRHPAPVHFVRFTSQGKSLLTVSWDGQARVWDIETGRELSRFGTPTKRDATTHVLHRSLFSNYMTGSPISASASADGQLLALASEEAIVLWNTPKAQPLRTIPMSRSRGPASCLYAPDGQTLTTVNTVDGPGGRTSRVVTLWDAGSGKVVRNLLRTEGFVRLLCYAPDSKLVAAEVTDGAGKFSEIRFWELSPGRGLGHVDCAKRGKPRSLAFAADGKHLAWANDEGTVHLHEAATGRFVRSYPLEQSVTDFGGSLAFSPDGKVLAVKVGYQPAVNLWDVNGENKLRSVALDAAVGGEHTIGPIFYGSNSPEDFAYSPDGKRLALAAGHALIIVDPTLPIAKITPDGHRAAVTALAFSADGRHLHSWGCDGAIGTWNNADDKLSHWTNLPAGSTKPSFSRDGRLALVGGPANAIEVWELSKKTRIQTIQVDDETFRVSRSLGGGGLECSADGRLLAGSGEAGPIRVWDAATGALRLEIPLPVIENRKRVFGTISDPTVAAGSSLTFSPDGRLLAAALLISAEFDRGNVSRSGEVWLFDLVTGKPLRHFGVAGGGVASVAFSPDSRWLATLSRDGMPALWETASGQRKLTWEHTAGSQAISPDGNYLASGGKDGTVRLWDSATGQLLLERPGHRGPVTSLAFHSGGSQLASGSRDTSVMIWDLAGLKPAQPAERALEATELAALWRELLEDAGRAQRARSALLGSPRETVHFFARVLKPVPTIRPQLIAGLLAGLNSEDFTARERATADLAQLGELARSALEADLARPLSAERRRRVTNLLEQIASRPLAPETLRALRAVEILERVGTNDAATTLRDLANGAAGVELTRSAHEAIHRLKQHPKSTAVPGT